MSSWLAPLLCLLSCTGPALDTDSATPVGDATIGALHFEGPLPDNVLILTLDTVRKDYLGHYGEHSDTPWVDAFMDDSLVFDDHRSCSNWTLPAIVCLYSGQSPVELGFEPISSDPAAPNYASGMFFAPAWLRDRGYATWMSSANAALRTWLDADARVEGVFDHGFDGWWYVADAPAADVVDGSLALVDAMPADTPWWGHVQIFDPHSPWNAPAEYLAELDDLAPISFDLTDQDEHYRLAKAWAGLDADTQALVRQHVEVQYTAEVRYLDDQLARLWTALDDRGLLDRTLVVLWTDHGEQFFEHAELGHDVSMYREEVDLALALWARNLSPGRFDGPTTMVDVLPTALEVLGEPHQEGFTGQLLGAAAAPRARFGFRYKVATTARQVLDYDGRRLLYDWTGERYYFETADDPLELSDRYDPAEPRVQELEVLLADQTDRILAFLPHLDAVGHDGGGR